MEKDAKSLFSDLGESNKVRLTLAVTPAVKDELKRQARELGVSPSAYVAVIVGERRMNQQGW